MAYATFQHVNETVERFLDFLSSLEITPPAGSSFESEFLSVFDLLETWRNAPSGSHSAEVLRSAGGVYDLAAKVLQEAKLPDWEWMLPHLQMVGSQKFPKSSMLQNAKAAYDDDPSRKLTELYVACLAGHIGHSLLLDHPFNAKGDNPDVLFDVIPPAGSPTRWALAIKTIFSVHGQTIFERIKEGAQQIDACSASKGMVVINARDALDHAALWAPPQPFANLDSAKVALLNQLTELAEKANKDRSHDDWDRVFSAKVVAPVIFMGQSLVALPTSFSTQTPTLLKCLLIWSDGRRSDTEGFEIASSMNEVMQKIL